MSAADATIDVAGRTVGRIGLGTNRLTNTEENREFLRYAVSRRLSFVDTAHLYTNGDSERTIGAALSPPPDDVVIATKGGYHAADPDTLEREFAESLERLGVSSVFLYQLHRVDRHVPLEESMRTLKAFRDDGRIQHIGLSEVTVEQIERAQEVAPIVSVQNEYNLSERRHEPVLDHATERGIVFIPYFPLRHSASVDAKLAQLAPRYDAAPTQVALAWLLQRSPMMLPIPGTLSRDHLDENLAAPGVELSSDDFGSLA